MEDCNLCDYCKPKEREQTKNKEPHMCLLLGKALKHETQSQNHYKIKPHKDCPLNNIISTNCGTGGSVNA